jgi:hypothetical protein
MVVCIAGGVSERSKETVLKTVGPNGSRGFESHPLRVCPMKSGSLEFELCSNSRPMKSAVRMMTLGGINRRGFVPLAEDVADEWAEDLVRGTLYACGLSALTIGEVAEWSKALAC